MIDDVIFDTVPFILEYPTAVTGNIVSYSMDGSNYDFTIIFTGATSGLSESSYVFVS